MPLQEIEFRTAEVARVAEVSLRQLQVWEEKRVAVASRRGRARVYDATQAIFVVVCAELRRRGLSFQRVQRVAAELRQILVDYHVAEMAGHRQVFVLTDGRRVHFADSQNKICELVSNLFRPFVCVNLSDCLQRVQNAAVIENRLESCPARWPRSK